MLCYVILCYVMLCYVALCYVISSVHGESLVNAGCTVTLHGWCPLEFCTLSLLVVVAVVSADFTPPRDVGDGKEDGAHDVHVSCSKFFASKLKLRLHLVVFSL